VKLYLVTRQDLPPGARAAQLCHALRQFGEDHPEVDRDWFRRSNTLVLLEGKDEHALSDLADKARLSGVPVAVFREPDLADALTAIAVGPKGKRLVRGLPLALRA